MVGEKNLKGYWWVRLLALRFVQEKDHGLFLVSVGPLHRAGNLSQRQVRQQRRNGKALPWGNRRISC